MILTISKLAIVQVRKQPLSTFSSLFDLIFFSFFFVDVLLFWQIKKKKFLETFPNVENFFCEWELGMIFCDDFSSEATDGGAGENQEMA